MSLLTRTHLCVSWFYAAKEDLDFAKARHLHRRLRSDTQRVNGGLFKGKDPSVFSRDMLQSGYICATHYHVKPRSLFIGFPLR